ncbi:hypothetical protein B0H34DRAFT_6116 [Crassisporium funariophilum]|nr:hypothetical protein B0H34DRAFT_6116 [Crassisporium funariophilum]
MRRYLTPTSLYFALTQQCAALCTSQSFSRQNLGRQRPEHKSPAHCSDVVLDCTQLHPDSFSHSDKKPLAIKLFAGAQIWFASAHALQLFCWAGIVGCMIVTVSTASLVLACQLCDLC